MAWELKEIGRLTEGKMKARILLMGVLFLTLPAAFAQNDRGRVNSSDQETNTADLFGGPALAKEQQGRPFQSPIVIDSQGKEVGPYLSGEEVLRKIDGRWFGLPISTNGFVNTGIPSLFYATTDCTGPPYELPLDTGPLTELVNTVAVTVPFGAALGVFNGNLYYVNMEPPQTRNLQSQQNFDLKTGTASCELNGVGNRSTVQIGIFDLSTLGFLPPFSLSEGRPRR